MKATPHALAERFALHSQLFEEGTVVVDLGNGQALQVRGEELVEMGSGASSLHSRDPRAPPPCRMSEPKE